MTGTRDLIIATLTSAGSVKDLPELARQIGKSVSTTRSSLGRLLVAKKVEQRSDGSYALPGWGSVAPPPVRTMRTHWILLGDRSGSMGHLEKPTLDEMNRTLDTIALTAQQPNHEVVVSLWSFGSSSTPEFRCLPAAQVRHLQSYRANMGGTAMFDAMGDAITQAEADERGRPDTCFVLMVLTDGEENESRRWAKNTGNSWARTGARDVSKILELIRRVQGTDKWTVALQVPGGGYKTKLCRDFGIHEGNVAEWDTLSEHGAREAGAARSAGIANYAVQRAAGKTSVKSMFVTTDLSKVSASDVRSLDNVTSRVKIYTVKREEDIKGFIERETGRPFVPGTSFYQLTKTESRVQPNKKILVMEMGNKTVWGGHAARRLIGLPDGQHCRVKPGNHSNLKIFIQSKSDNRKLVRGTELIHAPMGM